MTMTDTTQPTAISAAQRDAALDRLGIEHRDRLIQNVEIAPGQVTVTQLRLDDNGRPYPVGHGADAKAATTTTTIAILAGGSSLADARFSTEQRADGRWGWRLKHANGNTLVAEFSQGYENEAEAHRVGWKVVTGQYLVEDDTDG